MYENATLQEAYTGSLIAGKGKLLNNIRTIMEKTRFKSEDWARVRFGAGTPWRRCWCVITPPDEKDVQKQQKQMRKKSAYQRFSPLKGTIKFYDTKKTKKVTPIATINDSFSAYAIYPQSKPLIDQSTLIKLEGSITIHSKPDITTEGFVFVMPEVHPAISGFEMLLRFLFPVYDIFGLYGRPTRLIADTIDTRSLMFALPQERRYGYLEILDVASLIHETGSQSWSEREWRKKLKELTATRMTRMTTNGRPRSRASSYRDYRNSLPASRGGGLRYEDGASIRSTPSLINQDAPPLPPPHTNSAPPEANEFQPPGTFTPKRPQPQHQRSFSEQYPASEPRYRKSQRERPDQSYTPSRLSHEQQQASYQNVRSGRPSYEQPPPQMNPYDAAPPPPTHGIPIAIAAQEAQRQRQYEAANGTQSRSSSESEQRYGADARLRPQELNKDLPPSSTPQRVVAPPAFSHEPGAKPQKRPGISPDLRRANSRLSVTTLQQLAEAGQNSTSGGGAAAAGAAAAWRSNSGYSGTGLAGSPEEPEYRGVNHAVSKGLNTADRSTLGEGNAPMKSGLLNPNMSGARSVSNASSQSDAAHPPYYKDKPLMSSYDLLTPSTSTSRKPSPLSHPAAASSSATDQSQTKSYFVAPAKNFADFAKPPVTTRQPPSEPVVAVRPTPVRSDTSKSITRKPVGAGRTPTQSRSRSPKRASPTRSTKSSAPSLPHTNSLNDQYIDEDALANVLARSQTMTSASQASGHADDRSIADNDSTVSPDYASTRRSTDTKRSERSIEKPRRGKLKTVGNVEPELPGDVHVGDTTYRPGGAFAPQEVSSDIPSFDFGTTQYYDPVKGNRPTTSGTMAQDSHQRPKSAERMTPSPVNETLVEPQRPNGSPSPRYDRPQSRNLITPEPQLRSPSTNADNRRSVVWQPGAQIGGSPGAKQTVTPEQYVQQRAQAGRVTPVFAHGRQNSASPTPPKQTPEESSKAARNKLQKRNSSYSKDVPSRPNSRAASNLINVSGDYSTHLTAREQEHVAKVTGAPLVNMASNANKLTKTQETGLVGAISAREKEKKDMKEGYGGQMVQQAIAQRQQQAQQQQTYPKRNSSYGMPTQPYAPPQPSYTMPGGFPPSPVLQQAFPPQQPQQQGWNPQQMQYQQFYQQQQYPQQQQQWSPPSAGQLVGSPQNAQYQQQYAPQNQFYQNAQGQSPYGQGGQQQYYGGYNNQGGR